MSAEYEKSLEKKYKDELYPKARKVKTVEELKTFAKKCSELPQDYGSICVTVAAMAIAGAWCANAFPNGGITGFQAGAIMWEFLGEWNDVKFPAKLVEYEEMLYPQYEEKFQKTINKETWKFLQTEASKMLLEDDRGVPSVREHWLSIQRGEIPFGYTIKAD